MHVCLAALFQRAVAVWPMRTHVIAVHVEERESIRTAMTYEMEVILAKLEKVEKTDADFEDYI